MKKFTVFVAIAALGTSAFAWTPGERMSQAVAEGLALATISMAGTEGLGLSGDTALLGGFTAPGREITFTRYVRQGETYAFIATGDNSARDVDIRILNESGTVIAQDDDSDRTAVATLRPTRSGQIKMCVKLYSGMSSGNFVSVVTLSSDGFQVPVNAMATAVAEFRANASAAARQWNGASFHDGANQWALFGSVLEPGETYTVNNLTLTGRTAILGGCDANSDDIDLWLTGNGRTLSDTDPDDRPIINSTASGNHSVRIKNEGRGTSFAVFGIVRPNGNSNRVQM